jgi:hypothetical protein
MTGCIRLGISVAVLGLSLCTYSFAAAGQATGAAGVDRPRAVYSFGPGSAADLKGVSTVFVLVEGGGDLRDKFAERIGDLPLQLTEDADGADVLLVLVPRAGQWRPSFGLPDEYRRAEEAGGPAVLTGAIVRQRGSGEGVVVFHEAYAAAQVGAAADELITRFLEAYRPANGD